ncbi:MAG: 23S rRNA (guanosine(2251)-2'-O)-methyltransferase RlmB [Acidobacteriota bacterium]|nr:23S rRNA (guanosine(2251)-2'-O)-methyltransferase RlmB [Blastocatellia bacterium]MDW8412508.1 23S rRNA (guanosine(2251)-2'-O)-methyltransferase RlmB [Acidobacteriota bacterium]
MKYIYGVNPVLEALRSGQHNLTRLYIARDVHNSKIESILTLARSGSVPVQFESRHKIDALVPAATHQGVVAVLQKNKFKYADFDQMIHFVPSGSLLLILDCIQDPRNLGAAIRTAECAGVSLVIIPEHHSSAVNETVAKASAGAIEYLPICRVTNLVNTIEKLKNRNIWIVGLDAAATTEYTSWDYTTSTAIVLGNEGRGMRRLVREHCDIVVSIPLIGQVSSLNVSAAAAVVLYEAVRQRRAKSSL